MISKLKDVVVHEEFVRFFFKSDRRTLRGLCASRLFGDRQGGNLSTESSQKLINRQSSLEHIPEAEEVSHFFLARAMPNVLDLGSRLAVQPGMNVTVVGSTNMDGRHDCAMYIKDFVGQLVGGGAEMWGLFV